MPIDPRPRMMFDKAARRIAAADQTFLVMATGPNPLTREELAALIEKYPVRWERYRSWLDKLPTAKGT